MGFGRIGSATAARAKSLGMDVAFFDPFLPDGWDKASGVRAVESLDELLKSIAGGKPPYPLTESTRKMIDAEAIAKMPRGAYLINTAGAAIDTAAVPPAIASGQLAGAGIDVLPEEPPRDDDPLVRSWHDPEQPAFHRVLINPHSAFYCEEGLMEMRARARRHAARHCSAKRPATLSTE